jgi:hypothetical protein
VLGSIFGAESNWVRWLQSGGAALPAFVTYWCGVVFMCFGGETWSRRLFGRLRHRWDDDIKPDIEEIVWCVDTDRIGLAEDRDKWRVFVKTVMNIWVL